MIGAVVFPAGGKWIPPVGLLVELDTDLSPAMIWDGTTWTQHKDRIVVGAGDHFKAGTSGGSAVAALTSLPMHEHSAIVESDGEHTHTAASSYFNSYNNGGVSFFPEGSTGLGGQTDTTKKAGDHTHTVTLGAVGGGQEFSIQNPYVAVNVWERVG